MPELKWKCVTRRNGGPYHEATNTCYGMQLVITPMGGHITAKRYILEVFCKGEAMTTARFGKLEDAKQWAEDLFSQEGATLKAIQLIPLYT